MFFNDKVLGALISKLDTAALRHRVIAHNIANLNTPGYKRSYVVFSEELLQAKKGLPLARTHDAHLPGRQKPAGPAVKKELSTTSRSDGNNVDLDREMLDLVINQLRYNALVQQVAERYEKWRYIINEGRR